MSQRLHIDTDGGVDDAIALILAARSPVELVSLSSVFGNTDALQAATNARAVLRLSGRRPSVYVGAGYSLLRRPPPPERPAHGHDGLNGESFPLRWRLPVLNAAHAASPLALAAHQGIDGVCFGPLTNLALALLEGPAALRRWAPVVSAGAFNVVGRGRRGADFNTSCDPEALQRVLDSNVLPRLVPLDATLRVKVPLSVFEDAARRGPPLLQRLRRAVAPYAAWQEGQWGGEGVRPHDAVTLAARLHPELFRFEPTHLSLDPTRTGRILRGEGPMNSELCVDLDVEAVTDLIVRALYAAAEGFDVLARDCVPPVPEPA